MLSKMLAGAGFGAVAALYIVDPALMLASLVFACVVAEVAWRWFER